MHLRCLLELSELKEISQYLNIDLYNSLKTVQKLEWHQTYIDILLLLLCSIALGPLANRKHYYL